MILQTGVLTHGHRACNIYSRIWLLARQRDASARVRLEPIGHDGNNLHRNSALAGLLKRLFA